MATTKLDAAEDGVYATVSTRASASARPPVRSSRRRRRGLHRAAFVEAPHTGHYVANAMWREREFPCVFLHTHGTGKFAKALVERAEG